MNAGFVALIIYALNGIRMAQQRNALPVLVYGEKDVPYFYESTKGSNVWEYYFEPISPVSFEELQHWRANGLVTNDQVHINTAEEAIHGHQYDEDRLATFWAWDTPKDKKAWMLEKRALGRKFLKAHLKVNAEIQLLANRFAEKNFQENDLIGVHIRGTDFQYADPIPISLYFKAIDEWVTNQQLTKYQIFVATDQQQFVQQFEKQYPGKIVTTDALRSSNHIAPFKKEGASPYQKGADVLLDILLLAKCHYLIKGAAAVGEFATWLTDEQIPIRDFSPESEFKGVKYYELRSAYLRLNINNKSRLGIWIHETGEFLTKCFMYFPLTRFLFNKYEWARKILKH